MSAPVPSPSLASVGLGSSRVRWQLTAEALTELAERRDHCVRAAEGPLVCLTGGLTGRSPLDKFIVRDTASDSLVDWGAVNQPMSAEHFDRLAHDLVQALDGRELFARDCWAGADPTYRLPIRVVTELAWHNLFARNLLIDEPSAGLPAHDADRFTVIDAPSFQADPARHGTRSGVFIVLNFTRRLVLIGGTQYAGEIKKSVFSLMNFMLPARGVLPMHCSANIGPDEDVALFFGLSGTGKTTLSSDPGRRLIGDDEHGWSDQGVFNFEGGCYAKVIRLSAEQEPQIFATTRRAGTVLENVVVDPVTGRLDLDDDRLTENTRAAYPIEFIEHAEPSGRGGHPRHVIMLTADAFGVVPPIARLTPDGAMFHFLSGYTAKVAGTERGVTEPRATFSACFGSPFLPLPAARYATLLGEKIARHEVRVWLVNTGWSGGAYGVGARMKIAHTRAMIRAALEGTLDRAVYDRDPVFNLDVPRAVPGVPSEVLAPRRTWTDGAAYDRQALTLARMFEDNFRQFEAGVSASVRAAGPSGASARA
jgi:phosphoenolpyruvate carboxykinase (ATP)